MRSFYKIVFLYFKFERAVFHLTSDYLFSYSRDGLRAPQDLRAAFAQAKPPDHAFLDRFAQRLQHHFNRYLRIDAVLIVEIDINRIELLE